MKVGERKGLGHPDTICDAVMDAVSGRSVRNIYAWQAPFFIHNLDKSLLSAGQAEKTCGGGTILQLMEFVNP